VLRSSKLILICVALLALGIGWKLLTPSSLEKSLRAFGLPEGIIANGELSYINADGATLQQIWQPVNFAGSREAFLALIYQRCEELGGTPGDEIERNGTELPADGALPGSLCWIKGPPATGLSSWGICDAGGCEIELIFRRFT